MTSFEKDIIEAIASKEGSSKAGLGVNLCTIELYIGENNLGPKGCQ